MKPSEETAVSEATILMHGLTVDKSYGAESTADSILEAQSLFSESTSTGQLASSRVKYNAMA